MEWIKGSLTEEQKAIVRKDAEEYNNAGKSVKIDWNVPKPICSLCWEYIDENGECVCGVNKVKGEEYEKYIARKKAEKRKGLFSALVGGKRC